MRTFADFTRLIFRTVFLVGFLLGMLTSIYLILRKYFRYKQ